MTTVTSAGQVSGALPGSGEPAGPGVGLTGSLRRVRAVPRAPTCAVAKSNPRRAFLAPTCGFISAPGLSGLTAAQIVRRPRSLAGHPKLWKAR